MKHIILHYLCLMAIPSAIVLIEACSNDADNYDVPVVSKIEEVEKGSNEIKLSLLFAEPIPQGDRVLAYYKRDDSVMSYYTEYSEGVIQGNKCDVDITGSLVGYRNYSVEFRIQHGDEQYTVGAGHFCTLQYHSVDLGLSVNWDSYNAYASSESSSGKWLNSEKMFDLSDYCAGYSCPSKAQLQELVDNCEWTWTEVDSKKGYKVTGPNGNSIFLPASGIKIDSKYVNNGKCGYYRFWDAGSSSFDDYQQNGYYFFYRYVGYLYFDEKTIKFETLQSGSVPESSYCLTVRPYCSRTEDYFYACTDD